MNFFLTFLLIFFSTVVHADTEMPGWEDLPPALRTTVGETMKKGYEAAIQKDYLSAIRHFEEVRKLAPNNPAIYYNLGLAESKVPGREFRAMVWFGAYLAADPGSPQAAVIKESIPKLGKTGLIRFLSLTEEVADQISDAELKDSYLAEIVDLWARTGDIATAFQKCEGISSVNELSQAKLFISNAQLNAGDVPGAIETVDGIQDPFRKILGKQNIADAQRKSGNSAAALQILEEAFSLFDSVEDPGNKSIVTGYIAMSQAKAGGFTAALRTADSISDTFGGVSLAKGTIAEAQAKAGDADGAQQTLAAALEAAEKIQGGSRDFVMQQYAESKARIDAGTPGNPSDQAAVTAPPSVAALDWVSVNETLLNTPFFMDLGAAMKTLPQDYPKRTIGALKEMAGKMIEAHDVIQNMFKEQEQQGVPS